MKCPHCNNEIDDFERINYEGREIRFYKWVKPVKDFPIPKGFKLIEHRDFIDLVKNKIFVMKKCPNIYFTKNYSKINQKKCWRLSRVWAVVDDLGSYDVNLRNSSDNGWVVVIK